MSGTVAQEECKACDERAGVEHTEEEERVEEQVTPPQEDAPVEVCLDFHH